jgi:hypothetical protein
MWLLRWKSGGLTGIYAGPPVWYIEWSGGAPNIGGAWLCLLTVSSSAFVRPIKKKRAAAKPKTTTAPTAMPAIAPAERPLLCPPTAGAGVAVTVEPGEDDEVDVAVDADAEAVPSAGKSSPGCSMYFEFLAISF